MHARNRHHHRRTNNYLAVGDVATMFPVYFSASREPIVLLHRLLDLRLAVAVIEPMAAMP